jgi:N6-adenosine-specific RNA methylase IME4
MKMGSSILFKSTDSTVALVDIPRSLEEAQELPDQTVWRRIISSDPLGSPWEMPEPKLALTEQTSKSPSVAIAELMNLEAVKTALEKIKCSHCGPWCLPRIVKNEPRNDNEVKELRKRKKTSPENTVTASSSAPPYIPTQSRFLWGSVESQREEFLKTAPSFDLVVLDPPWPSRSVKRKRSGYKTVFDMDEARSLLSQIPITSHLRPDGLVAVWITNKAAITDLLTSSGGLFSQWGLEPIGEWIWLKITCKGDPIFDVESQWRKPWERLLIARNRGSSIKLPTQRKVILGVPDIHSRKPNLRALFNDLLPEGYIGLEVFARNLTAGWWSWGDEAFMFQQRHHWVEEQT